MVATTESINAASIAVDGYQLSSCRGRVKPGEALLEDTTQVISVINPA